MTLAMLPSATFALHCKSTVSWIFCGVVPTRIEWIGVDWSNSAKCTARGQTELPPVGKCSILGRKASRLTSYRYKACSTSNRERIPEIDSDTIDYLRSTSPEKAAQTRLFSAFLHIYIYIYMASYRINRLLSYRPSGSLPWPRRPAH